MRACAWVGVGVGTTSRLFFLEPYVRRVPYEVEINRKYVCELASAAGLFLLTGFSEAGAEVWLLSNACSPLFLVFIPH